MEREAEVSGVQPSSQEMTSLRDDLIEAGAEAGWPLYVAAGGNPGRTARLKAAAVLDAMLDKLEEHADEIPAIVKQHGWRCRNCGGSHNDAGCDNPDIPVVWSAFTIADLLSVLRVKP